MRGVIMETKNGRAVLLTRGGEFVNIKDKNYSVGDKVNIALSTGRLCTMAASLAVICAGIGSYFTPAGYVSVDINPSLIMTVNIYNRVIDVKSLNDDAQVLLSKIDIKGKSAESSVEMLIKASEDIGYINDNNRSVILDVVSGITKPNIENVEYDNIDITKETADMETFRIAQNVGVSIAKAKAIEEYTEKNGGDISSNAAKLNYKSVKEIRNIMLDTGALSDKKADDAPLQNTEPQEIRTDDISEPSKPQENSKPSYSINNNSFPIIEPRRNIPPANQPQTNEYRPSENMLVKGNDRPQERPSALDVQPHWDITPIDNQPQPEQKPQDDKILQEPKREAETAQEKPSTETKPIQANQKPQDSASPPNGSRPQGEFSESSEPVRGDDKLSGGGQQITEQKPQNGIPNQGGGKAPDNLPQSGGQKAPDTAPFDNQQAPEEKPNSAEWDDDKPQYNPSAPAEPKYEPGTEQDNQSAEEDNDTYGPDNNSQADKPQQENNAPHSGPKPQMNVPEQNNNALPTDARQPGDTKQESNMPPQAEPKPQENVPMQNNAPPTDAQPPGEAQHGNASPQNEQPQQSAPQNDGGSHISNEGMSGHVENTEIP